jgi:hypothetical protein
VNFDSFKHSYKTIVKHRKPEANLYRSFHAGGAVFSRSNQLRSGERWVVGSEIFWKARGDHGLCAETAIACVFKKFMSQLPDGRPQVHKVARNAQHEKTNDFTMKSASARHKVCARRYEFNSKQVTRAHYAAPE